MQYLLDTVTIVRHFTGKGKMGRAAAQVLDSIEDSNNRLVISVVSLMEIMYLAEAHRIDINLSDTLFRIEESSSYSIVDLNPEILQVASALKFPELHDRLILATAKWLDVPILSSDRAFAPLTEITVIWK